jgi:hypothetical protein
MPEYLDIVSTLVGLPVVVADFQKDVADWQNICRMSRRWASRGGLAHRDPSRPQVPRAPARADRIRPMTIAAGDRGHIHDGMGLRMVRMRTSGPSFTLSFV